MRLKAIRSVTVEDGLDGGIYPKKLRMAPPDILQSVWKKGHNISAGVDLAWYRGHHAGIYDAFLTLKKQHPRIAKHLREAFNMNDDGSLG